MPAPQRGAITTKVNVMSTTSRNCVIGEAAWIRSNTPLGVLGEWHRYQDLAMLENCP